MKSTEIKQLDAIACFAYHWESIAALQEGLLMRAITQKKNNALLKTGF